MTEDGQHLGNAPEVVLPTTTLPIERGSWRWNLGKVLIAGVVGATLAAVIFNFIPALFNTEEIKMVKVGFDAAPGALMGVLLESARQQGRRRLASG